MRTFSFSLILFVSLLGAWPGAQAQYVGVTLQSDKTQLRSGEKATIRVFAQIVAEHRAESSQIFSWYLDFQNKSPLLADADYASLLKETSDKDPRISSFGTTADANQIGIYDTFLNLPAAGLNSPIELFRLSITAKSAGTAIFAVAPGSGVPSIAADFLVEPVFGEEPLIGGVYSQNELKLMVVPQDERPRLTITRPSPGQVLISWPTIPGKNYYLQSSDGVGQSFSWTVLPNGPHNSGSLQIAIDGKRFFRLRID